MRLGAVSAKDLGEEVVTRAMIDSDFEEWHPGDVRMLSNPALDATARMRGGACHGHAQTVSLGRGFAMNVPSSLVVETHPPTQGAAWLDISVIGLEPLSHAHDLVRRVADASVAFDRFRVGGPNLQVDLRAAGLA